MSDLGFFQIAASVLGHGVCEILGEPIKSGVSISYNPLSLLYASSAAAAARSLQSCPSLCDPIDGSPPGSPIPGILQARILEWVAISFSNA